MRLLMIDNYDSFTWNLVQSLRGLGRESGLDCDPPVTTVEGELQDCVRDAAPWSAAEIAVDVVRNDEVDVARLCAMRPDGVVLSPGPGTPDDAGICVEAVRLCAREGIPLLGVCLGHQAVARALGARIGPARRVMHGKVSRIEHDGSGVLAGLPDPFEATRYHSLVVDASSLPSCLVVTARSEDGEVMALRHRRLPLEGVQFHPESICTPVGRSLLRNFVRACARRADRRACEGLPEIAAADLLGALPS